MITSCALVPWRSDGRCGKYYPKDGEPGQCDPTKSGYKLGPCCSSKGECGDSADHCLCKGCINYNRDENGKIYVWSEGQTYCCTSLKNIMICHFLTTTFSHDVSLLPIVGKDD